MSAPLMVSISGIRGIAHESFTKDIIEKYTTAFGKIVSEGKSCIGQTIIVGRDSRISGQWALEIVLKCLTSLGYDVLEIGIVPTPTVQYEVIKQKSLAGIVITSSHNPKEWNGLKFVGSDGLFLSPPKCKEMFALIPDIQVNTTENAKGMITLYSLAVKDHIKAIIELPEINVEKVKPRKFKVVLDTINGAGGPIMKELLEIFGCEVVCLHYETNGDFFRSPEPINENLTELCEAVKTHKADFGVATDPDVDRCVFINELGVPLGEEYTLAMAVEYWLGICGKRGNIVKNLSSSNANDEIAKKYGCKCLKAAVGESNVAEKMLQENAILGGEGNGGVMLPDIHIGRDAPVAAALVISLLSHFDGTISQLKQSLPQWEIVKMKISIDGIDIDPIIMKVAEEWRKKGAELSTIDGVHIQTDDFWVHLRKSNTEPVVRVIAESRSMEEATRICTTFMKELQC
jgi:phosphomannomutase